ncbi:MAG: TIGR00269 family protein [Euryarchaeota archaeon]|nr:TIGR00269 family protein [Euryarchaeota archaeon]
MVSCSICGERACYHRRYSGQRFCAEHFLEYFERKVKKTMLRYRMVERGERIGVAVSGGKDSLTLLRILDRLAGRLSLELHAILIDEGIANYREETIERARRFCEELGVPLRVLSFREHFRLALDEAVRLSHRNACTFCGVFRRKLLNDAARELGCDRLATGHNLDDEVQAILMNFLRGDLERLLRLGTRTRSERLVPRIKPLMEMPEKEVALYALLAGIPASFEECPYAVQSFRTEVREMINRLEESNPGIKFSILRSYQKLLPLLESYGVKQLQSCRTCGEPSSGERCRACLLLEELTRSASR